MNLQRSTDTAEAKIEAPDSASNLLKGFKFIDSIYTIVYAQRPYKSQTRLIGRHNASCKNAKRRATQIGFALPHGAHQWALDIGLYSYT